MLVQWILVSFAGMSEARAEVLANNSSSSFKFWFMCSSVCNSCNHLHNKEMKESS